ncbi:MAG: hypothetical protein ABGY75_05390, partial [Gemmataceae bacterium]
QFSEAHNGLDEALRRTGDLDGAVREYRRGIELQPGYWRVHHNLGRALIDKRVRAGAISAPRQAIQLNPDFAPAHHHLRLASQAGMEMDGAILAYWRAAELDPKVAVSHGALGQALLARGEFAEARQVTARCTEMLPQGHPMRGAAQQQLQQCERLLALDARLVAVLKVEAAAADAAERLALAQLCHRYNRRFVAAARSYTVACAADPKLVDDPRAGHRYNAACSAAQAAVGHGKDAAGLGDE